MKRSSGPPCPYWYWRFRELPSLPNSRLLDCKTATRICRASGTNSPAKDSILCTSGCWTARLPDGEADAVAAGHPLRGRLHSFDPACPSFLTCQRQPRCRKIVPNTHLSGQFSG
jgi:hypothetical protein